MTAIPFLQVAPIPANHRTKQAWQDYVCERERGQGGGREGGREGGLETGAEKAAGLRSERAVVGSFLSSPPSSVSEC